MLKPIHFQSLFWGFWLFVSYKFLAQVEHSGIEIPHLDKVMHAGIFYILSFLLIQSYHMNRIQQLLLWLVYGCSIEWLQSLSGYRSGDFLDLLANMFGVVMLFISLDLWTFYRNRQRAVHLD